MEVSFQNNKITNRRALFVILKLSRVQNCICQIIVEELPISRFLKIEILPGKCVNIRYPTKALHKYNGNYYSPQTACFL